MLSVQKIRIEVGDSGCARNDQRRSSRSNRAGDLPTERSGSSRQLTNHNCAGAIRSDLDVAVRAVVDPDRPLDS